MSHREDKSYRIDCRFMYYSPPINSEIFNGCLGLCCITASLNIVPLLCSVNAQHFHKDILRETRVHKERGYHSLPFFTFENGPVRRKVQGQIFIPSPPLQDHAHMHADKRFHNECTFDQSCA